ncbi:hypothetical protein Q3G72_030745 [Acer saccharum]|nr:hypothetical protein Q3G72_030745 [Acer saccharum]
MFQVGLHQDTQTLNKLMAFCTDPSLGNLFYAEKVFNCVKYPCLFIYNLMIKAYAKKGSFRKSLSFFNELRENGLSPDNFTYPFVFKVIGCLREVKEGEKVHGHVVKTGLEFDVYVCNSIMDMYAVLGRIDRVKKLFDKMLERDVVSWNVLISGNVKCRRFEDALNFFRQMKRESILRPDEATVVSTLSACTALKSLELGEEIHRYVSTELGFTTIIGNALLDMYCKCGSLSVARKIFDEMPSKNVFCWTSMVYGYVTCGHLDDARDLFDRSPVKDIVLWTAMINGYVQYNRFDEAVSLFREMQIKRVKPDKFIVVALLTGCAQLGALEQGRWIHGYIDENRITVDAVVGTALIEIACRTYGNVKMGEQVAELLEKIESCNSSVHTLLANIYASADRWEDVTKVRRKMKDLGIKKVPGCSSIEVDGIVHEFLVGDPSHLEMGEIYSMLDRVAKMQLVSEENELEGDNLAAMNF